MLHLGCGQDSRFWRVDSGEVDWYDLDLTPVIELRRRFYPEPERYHLIASSVTDLDWMAMVTANGRPALVVAEGVLMYLSEAGGGAPAGGDPGAATRAGLESGLPVTAGAAWAAG
ncbi:MAG: uncharacterized protein H6Q38_1372 [Chloroflexi bacterium]|nr:uncharacterized protein [Chloroflexota bacterium]